MIGRRTTTALSGPTPVVLLGAALWLLAPLACQNAPSEGQEGMESGQAANGAADAASDAATGSEASGGVAMSSESSGDAVAAGGLLDPNEATRAQLVALPNVDEPTADALVAGRPYGDMLAVDQVLAEHLSVQERETLYGSLWKPLDLNTASAEEILLIPGVGDHMREEFEEYRPYRAMAQFRREIGKYVDEEEVARLEQYVTIR